MSDRYEIGLGDLKGGHPENLGHFAMTFVVKPPIEFASKQSRVELGSHVLNTINALRDDGFGLEETNSSFQSEHAKVSFTHDLPDKSATVGTISGHAVEAQLSNEIILTALDTVLNGNEK